MQSESLSAFLRGVLASKVEETAHAMVAVGNTNVLVSPPPSTQAI